MSDFSLQETRLITNLQGEGIWMHSQYLYLGLDLANFDHRVQSEVLTILLVHLAVHPDHGIVHLLVHPSHLQLVQVIVLLILSGEEKLNYDTCLVIVHQ